MTSEAGSVEFRFLETLRLFSPNAPNCRKPTNPCYARLRNSITRRKASLTDLSLRNALRTSGVEENEVCTRVIALGVLAAYPSLKQLGEIVFGAQRKLGN